MIMENKRVLILVMSCNRPNYRQKERVIRETYGKDVIDGLYDNIDLWFFSSGEHDALDFDNRRIFVKMSRDERCTTYQKFCKTVNLIEKHKEMFIDYDYILRVNTSTYINVKLLNAFLSMVNGNGLFSGTIFAQPWICHGLPFLSGEVLLFHRKYIDTIVTFYNKCEKEFKTLEKGKKTGDKSFDDKRKFNDDAWFSEILHSVLKDNYLKSSHNMGILFETEPQLTYSEDELSKYIAVALKTVNDNIANNDELDAHGFFDEIDNAKFRQMDDICRRKTVLSKEWADYFVQNIYDKTCKTMFDNGIDKRCKDWYPLDFVFRQYFVVLRNWCERNDVDYDKEYAYYKDLEVYAFSKGRNVINKEK